eukprot:TRINITY_DN22809_c0_g1_i1.p1 TRINITY_DN22809_c0_g1~~TRINITY_DN22809_c0_g1_i1.p1  ORF type:complete len:441 (-),score=92.04 TRINITY_DN22809_c0_g1_i1:120-1442(-)
MALHSLFVLNTNGEVFLEKHWRVTIPRSVVDDFWSQHCVKVTALEDVSPIIMLGKFYFIHLQTSDVILLGVLLKEAPPLMTLQLLERIVDVWRSYFDRPVSEDAIKQHFATAYQVLEEMVDFGFPVTTEPSVLKDLVPPPTLFARLRNLRDRIGTEDTSSSAVASDAKNFSLGAHISSDVPWRKRGVMYATNEIFFDVIEELDAIVDESGQAVDSRIVGRIVVKAYLSGMPTVTVTFANAHLLLDAAFHPCVSARKFDADRSLQFVPPDGEFVLMTYRAAAPSSLPFYVKPVVAVSRGALDGRISLMVGAKPGDAVADRGLHDVSVKLRLPRGVSAPGVNCNEGQTQVTGAQASTGCASLRWTVGRVTTQRTPTLNVTFHIPASYASAGYDPQVSVFFKLPSVALSGLKVEGISVSNERYKPYKGVKAVSMAGRFTIRAS